MRRKKISERVINIINKLIVSENLYIDTKITPIQWFYLKNSMRVQLGGHLLKNGRIVGFSQAHLFYLKMAL